MMDGVWSMECEADGSDLVQSKRIVALWMNPKGLPQCT